MGKNSAIEWTHHTFNPWRGCSKVSPGCKNCYAERQSKRNPVVLGVWGDNGARVVAAESYWLQPYAWNVAAERAGVHQRVFCASLADVFEDRPELVPWRRRLFELIATTLNLDWLLLTKRPENVTRLLQELCQTPEVTPGLRMLRAWTTGVRPPVNIWLGTSVEDQKRADERIPHLLKTPAAVRFLSCEPLLGPLEFSDVSRRSDAVARLGRQALEGIGWVIVGGESGSGARPMHPDWARSIRDQCAAAQVPFLFKQWGEHAWAPDHLNYREAAEWAHTIFGGAVKALMHSTGHSSFRVGKKLAGRLLDGRKHDEFPVAEAERC